MAPQRAGQRTDDGPGRAPTIWRRTSPSPWHGRSPWRSCAACRLPCSLAAARGRERRAGASSMVPVHLGMELVYARTCPWPGIKLPAGESGDGCLDRRGRPSHASLSTITGARLPRLLSAYPLWLTASRSLWTGAGISHRSHRTSSAVRRTRPRTRIRARASVLASAANDGGANDPYGVSGSSAA